MGGPLRGAGSKPVRLAQRAETRGTTVARDQLPANPLVRPEVLTQDPELLRDASRIVQTGTPPVTQVQVPPPRQQAQGPGTPPPLTGGALVWALTKAVSRGDFEGARAEVVRSLTPLLNNQMGVSLDELYAFNKFLYQGLAIGSGQQSKVLMDALSVQRKVYVNLSGEPGLYVASDPVTRAFTVGMSQARDDYLRDPEHFQPPPLPAELSGEAAKYQPVWDRLLQRLRRGEPLIEIDLDGDPARESPVERMTFRVLVEASNNRGELMRHIVQEQRYQRDVVPWMQQHKPALQARVDAAKQRLTPEWLGGDDNPAFGWRSTPGNVRAALELVLDQKTAAQGGRPGAVRRDSAEDIADLIVGLHSDTLTGFQTYWIKLLREASPEERQQLITRAFDAYLELNLGNGAGAPEPEHYERERGMRYAIGAAVMGLGRDREEVMQVLWQHLLVQKDAFQQRHQDLSARLAAAGGPALPNVDVAAFLRASDLGAATTTLARMSGPELERSRIALLKFARRVADPALGRELEQHLTLLLWLNDAGKRGLVIDTSNLATHPAWKAGVGPVGVSQFWHADQDFRRLPASVLEAATPTAQPVRLGASNVPENQVMPISVVLEGGGGKGLAFVRALQTLGLTAGSVGNVVGALEENRNTAFRIDEIVGTSAGSLTAAAMAAGYEPGADLLNMIQQLDPTNFYDGFLRLMGGVDPYVGGISRNGFFSLDRMYERLDKAIREGLLRNYGVSRPGPITFKDLPVNLRLVSTVISTDLPEEVRRQLGIGDDGKIVFSRETTPNFDVVAAAVGSAAVPAFFNSPAIEVFYAGPNGEMKRGYIQLVDGAVTNNFAAAHATHTSPNDALLMVPTYFKDDAGRELQLLDFAGKELPEIDRFNQNQLAKQVPADRLNNFLTQMQRQQPRRLVLGFNLATPEDQTQLVIQGRNRSHTRALLKLAEHAGISAYDPQNAARVFDANLNQPIGWQGAIEEAYTRLLGGGWKYMSKGEHGPLFHPNVRESQDLLNGLVAVVGAGLASTHQANRFEKPPAQALR